MIRILTFILLIVGILGLAACDKQRLYEQNFDFNQRVWPADSTPTFEFTIDEPGRAYNIYWNVRNTINYPFYNLYLTYSLEDTLGRRITTDLHNMHLFNPKTGEPYGDGLGDIFTHQIMALPGFKFDTAGVYQLKLEQYMRTDTLKDILSVGVRVEKSL